MTVKELIELLQKQDQDAIVCYEGGFLQEYNLEFDPATANIVGGFSV